MLVGFCKGLACLANIYITCKSVEVQHAGLACKCADNVPIKQGHPRAEYELGQCYAKGIGCFKSHIEAARWFERAASHGDDDAKVLIGTGPNLGHYIW